MDSINIFDWPKRYLDIIRSKPLIPLDKQKRHDGKSIVVVLPTRFCKVGCTHCFCHSKPKMRDNICLDEKNELSWDGCSKVIQFINSADVEYMLIAGGGEPFEKEDFIYYLVEHCKVNRAVIATNGFWGRTHEKACQVLSRLRKIVEERAEKLMLVLRLSVDQWHIARIGNKGLITIIDAFNRLIGEHNYLKLELHTIENDKSIDELQLHFPNSHKNDGTQVASDNDKVLKKSKKRGFLTLESGLKIPIGYAKLFYPNLLVNLNDSDEKIQRVLKPFYEDIKVNQQGNYSVIYNDDGTKGLDYLINFNGNITTWGNYQLENISNLYIDAYEDVQNNLYNDIISYSFIDRDHEFREQLIKPVNPSAILRAAAINVRDYSGAYMLLESHTALYYAIQVIRYYTDEGLIDQSTFSHFPTELLSVIHSDNEHVISLYSQSMYSIIQQYAEDSNCTKDDWVDLFKLIELKHFCVTDEQIAQGLEFFNVKYGTQYTEIHEVIQDIDIKSAIPRLIERMTFQQPRVSARGRSTSSSG
ncbi:radical SAM protein [Lihuaxuella thermophila]|uniref:4Fe-4S single cluster domain-containing protein n=1 Tax=Lihuaxuella thermophila TaxID=1173111 RepID=A0A1H8BTY7_9BACL|nr:radical SAM protein [Lihuaxuella thermophila]SEM85327.1 hypothetical protein SAMN05444955_102317 [Lihuaxuella thermophila]